jgi:hypothetical protein
MSRYVIDAAIAAKWIILDPLYSLTILAGGEGGFSAWLQPRLISGNSTLVAGFNREGLTGREGCFSPAGFRELKPGHGIQLLRAHGSERRFSPA